MRKVTKLLNIRRISIAFGTFVGPPILVTANLAIRSDLTDRSPQLSRYAPALAPGR
jgi:hypothetical protein